MTDPLQTSRRLDWRFLLPDPRLGHVACLGPCDEELRAALAALGGSPALLDASGAGAEPASFDVTVLRDARLDAVARGAELVRPGGWLYLELEGPSLAGGRPRTPRGYARALERLGLEEVELHWHAPTFERCAEIVPLDDPAAVRLALARHRTGVRSRLREGVARALLSAGAFPALVRCASVIGRRPAARRGEGPASLVAAFLEAERDRLGLERHGLRGPLSCLLVTPRFRGSRHVIVLVAERGSSRPAVVAKVPRLENDRGAAEREAANLRRASAGGLDTVPDVVAFEEVGGWPVLVETAVVGRPLAPAALRRDPRAVEAVVSWLEALGRVPSDRVEGGEERYERLLGARLAAFAASVPAGAAERRLVQETAELLAPLRGAGVEPVFEHGDVSHPNLLLLPDGRVGVLDWELAEPSGLPLNDLFFFLSYAAFARRRARSVQRQLDAFHDAFFGPEAWAARKAAGYAERAGVPRALLTPLFVACFARYALRLAWRAEGTEGPAGGEEPPFEAATVEWLRRNRYLLVWRHAVRRAAELAWPSGSPGG